MKSGIMPSVAILAAVLTVMSGACSFDSSRLDQLRQDGQITPDGDVPPQDLADLPEDLDAGDIEEDPTIDVPEDVPVDTPVDVADVPEDPTDTPQDPVTDPPPDVVGDPDVAGDPDAVEEPDAVADPDLVEESDLPPNEPPVLTVPGAQGVERERETIISGISVTDPDIGSAPMQISVTAGAGSVRLWEPPVGVTCTPSSCEALDGAALTFEGTLTDVNEALAGLTFQSAATGDTDSVDVTANDQGASGSGGPQTDTETISITISARDWDVTVQRGEAIIPTTGPNKDLVTLTAGAGEDYTAPASASRAFVRLVNTRLAGMGKTSGGGTQNDGNWMAWVDDTDPIGTSITFQRYNPDSTDNNRLTWEIIEYTGEVGGPNEFIVHDTGIAEIVGGDAANLTVSVDAGLSEVAIDDSRVVVFITGQSILEDGRQTTQAGLFTASWDDVNNEPVFTRSSNGSEGTGVNKEARLSYAVVEFVGSNWSVQRIDHPLTAAALASSGTADTATLDAAVDPSRTFLHVQVRTNMPQLDDIGLVAWLSDVDELSFEVDDGSDLDPDGGDEQNAVVWLVSNSQDGPNGMRVEPFRSDRSAGGGDPDTWTVTFPSETPDVEPDHASVIGECDYSAGANNNSPRGSVSLELTSANQVTLEQSESDQQQVVRFSVVQWPDD